MAEITVDASVFSGIDINGGLWGPFWTSPSVGYIVYNDSDGDTAVTKTADSGATWTEQDSAGRLQSGTSNPFMAAWFDKNTPGDSGTKIHVAFYTVNSVSGQLFRYAYFDTSLDEWGTPVTLFSSADTTATASKVGITKSRGGALFAAYINNISAGNDMFRSTDGTSWSSKNSPFAGDSFADLAKMYPANLADDNDIWCAYFDGSADELSLKTYDDSGNSWSETSISTSIVDNSSHDWAVFDGAVRHSDGHLLVAVWTAFDTAGADLLTFDITDAGTITATTNVITDPADVGYVTVFINQQNNDVYIAYFGDEGGGDALASLVPVFYKLSTDDMATWGSQTAYFATEDDYRGIHAGMGVGDQGGRFQPVFFDDDDNDIFVNDANDVEIAAAVGGGTAVKDIIGGGFLVFPR